MPFLEGPPRYNTDFLSQVWQGWIDRLWNNTQKKRIETNGNPSRGTAAPTQVFLNNVSGLKFAVGDEVYFNFALPDDWVPKTDLTFETHFYSSNTVAARYVAGDLDWQACALGETITAPGNSGVIASGDILLGTTANQLGAFNFTNISGSELSYDDHIFIRLARTASVGTAPASPADNPVLVHFEIEYTAFINK